MGAENPVTDPDQRFLNQPTPAAAARTLASMVRHDLKAADLSTPG